MCYSQYNVYLIGFVINRTESPVQEQAEGKPEVLAETCLRDVMRRAAYANIHAVLKPVLR